MTCNGKQKNIKENDWKKGEKFELKECIKRCSL